MHITEHGWWPCHHIQKPANLDFFRHSRISLIINGVGGTDVHDISVAVVSYRETGGELRSVGSVLQQGGSLDSVRDATFSDDERDEVQPENFIDWDSITEGRRKFLQDAGNPHAADAMHELLCQEVYRGMLDGMIRRKAPPPKAEYAAFAW